MIKKIVIGVDQSYKDIGVSVFADGKAKSIKHLKFANSQTNADIRQATKDYFNKIIPKILQHEALEVICIVERVRLHSQGFINAKEIKSLAALTLIIADVMQTHNIKTYSVDTRSWKSKIVGTSKPEPNGYGIDSKKYPTIKYCINNNYKKYIYDESLPNSYNDNIADSICIALYGFLPEKEQNLQTER